MNGKYKHDTRVTPRNPDYTRGSSLILSQRGSGKVAGRLADPDVTRPYCCAGASRAGVAKTHPLARAQTRLVVGQIIHRHLYRRRTDGGQI